MNHFLDLYIDESIILIHLVLYPRLSIYCCLVWTALCNQDWRVTHCDKVKYFPYTVLFERTIFLLRYFMMITLCEILRWMHITCYSCVSLYCIMSLEFYKHCLFYAILPSWMTWCTFSTYSWVHLMMGHLNIKIHNQSVATFEACMLFRGLCSTHGVITKGFLSILWVSESSFSRWQQNLMQILCSLSSAMSQGHKNHRMHSTQTHWNVSCTKT